ncbi:MAG TPA: cytochrome c oxidase assembly protein [Actinomycetota bacterium]|nr:cytochrome c oxidase assembly protein [Actinomycetota bacterium]
MLPAWHPHPDVWLVLGTVVAAYLIADRRHERRTGQPTPARQRKLFLGGMALLFVASEWPMHDLSENHLYAAHMVQHMLFTLVAAPLLVAGTPAWMLRDVLRPRWAFRAFRLVTRPLVAIVLFNGVLLFTHWPDVVTASVTGPGIVHFAVHVVVVGSAYVMWWPVVSPLPELPPINPPAQLLYLFIQSLAPTIPASFLTFGHEPLYDVYATFTRMWGIDVMTDQLVAGLIMKLGGGVLLWSVMAVVFFRWANREQREGWDALRFQGVEREIRAEMGR